jgi:hypothetical protein
MIKKKPNKASADLDERLEAVGEVADRIRETLVKYNVSAEDVDELLDEARREVFARHYPELVQRKAS